ncbi:hypothetical protein FB451DRAFT_1368138 [Mycena latifolia]|nr:hypothetical protein FB451DRAFT_1368138 [Mycena latifolia]
MPALILTQLGAHRNGKDGIAGGEAVTGSRERSKRKTRRRHKICRYRVKRVCERMERAQLTMREATYTIHDTPPAMERVRAAQMAGGRDDKARRTPRAGDIWNRTKADRREQEVLYPRKTLRRERRKRREGGASQVEEANDRGMHQQRGQGDQVNWTSRQNQRYEARRGRTVIKALSAGRDESSRAKYNIPPQHSQTRRNDPETNIPSRRRRQGRPPKPKPKGEERSKGRQGVRTRRGVKDASGVDAGPRGRGAAGARVQPDSEGRKRREIITHGNMLRP